MIVLAIGVASMMWTMSGVGGLYNNGADSLQSANELNESANESSVRGFGADAGPNQGGNIIGLVFTGLERIISLAGLVILLPVEMANIGFPWWFAWPVGIMTQTVAGIGILEFATQRTWS
jgi:hypothetical protein